MCSVVPVKSRVYFMFCLVFVIFAVFTILPFFSTYFPHLAHFGDNSFSWYSVYAYEIEPGNLTCYRFVNQNVGAHFNEPELKLKLFNVTLITGDKVYVAVYPDDRLRLRIESVDGSSDYGFIIFNMSESIYVIPENVDLRKLDLELFNINYLINEVYHEGSNKIHNSNTADSIPVFIEYSDSVLNQELFELDNGLVANKIGDEFDSGNLVSSRDFDISFKESLVSRLFPELKTDEGLKYNLSFEKTYKNFPAISAKVRSESVVKKLVDNPDIKKIWLDRKFRASLDESVPFIHVSEVWDLGYDGTGVDIAILDTGIDDTHPDLDDLDDIPYTNDPKVVVKVDFTDDNTTDDLNGHGTHCAGIAAGTGSSSNSTLVNGSSYKGVAPNARLWNVKVLDKVGMGSESDIIAGIEFATFGPDGVPDTGDEADILSISLGGPSQRLEADDPLTRAVNMAVEHGIVVVVAAGNGGGNGYSTISSPGSASKVITVGSSGKDGFVSASSGKGPTNDFAIKPDVLAPGEMITAPRSTLSDDQSIEENDNYTVKSGTSISTPHVAGVSALLLQAHPDWTPEQVKNILISTSDDIGNEYNVYMQGGGLVNASRAIEPKIYVNPATFTFKNFGNGFGNSNNGTVISIKNISGEIQELNLSLDVIDIFKGESLDCFYLNESKFILEPEETKYVELKSECDMSNITTSIFSGKINISLCRPHLEMNSSPTGTNQSILSENLTDLLSFENLIQLNPLESQNSSTECEYFHSIFGFAKWNAVTVTKINMTGQPSIDEPVLIFSDSSVGGSSGQFFKIMYTNNSGMTTIYLPNGTYNIISTGKTENRCALEEAVYRSSIETGESQHALNVYRGLRDSYLKKEYVNLYYTYNPDIKRVLLENPLLLIETGKLAVKYSSFLSFDDEGFEYVFTSEDVRELQNYAERLEDAVRRSSNVPLDRARDISGLIEEFKIEIDSFEGRSFKEALADSVYSDISKINIQSSNHNPTFPHNFAKFKYITTLDYSEQPKDASVYIIKEDLEVNGDTQITLDERDTVVIDFDYNKSDQIMSEKFSVLYYDGDVSFNLWLFNLYSFPEGTETYISASESFKAILRYSYFPEKFFNEINPFKVNSTEFHMLMYNLTGISNHTTFSPDYEDLVRFDIEYRTPIHSENAIWTYDCLHPDLFFNSGLYYETDAPLSRVDWISPKPITCSIFYSGLNWTYTTPEMEFSSGTTEGFSIGEHPLRTGFDFEIKSVPAGTSDSNSDWNSEVRKLRIYVSGTITEDFSGNGFKNPVYLKTIPGNISILKDGEVLVNSEKITNPFYKVLELNETIMNETNDFEIVVQGGNSPVLSTYVRNELNFTYNKSTEDADYHPPKISFRFPNSGINNMIKAGKVGLEMFLEDESGLGNRIYLEYSLDGGNSWKKALLDEKYENENNEMGLYRETNDGTKKSIFTSNLTCYNADFISLRAYAEDLAGNANNFTVLNAVAVLPQNITILSPENKFYTNREIPLTVEINLGKAGVLNGLTGIDSDSDVYAYLDNLSDYLSVFYNLNGGGNITIPFNIGINFTSGSKTADTMTNNGGNDTITVSTIIEADEGENHLAVYVVEKGGGFFEVAEVDFVVDTVPPVLTNLTVIPENPAVGDLVEIVFQTELESGVEVNITHPNGSIISIPTYRKFNGWTGSVKEDLSEYGASFTASLFGEYLIEVKTIDKAGNINSAALTVNVILDTMNSVFVPSGTTVTVIENEQITIKVTAIAEGNGTAVVYANISDYFAFPVSMNNSGKDYGVKYLDISSQLINISTVTIFWHYIEGEIIELDEDSLTILFFDGNEWVDCGDYVGESIPGGPFVFDTGVKLKENYVYLLVNHSSSYAIGGNYSIPGKISNFNYTAGINWVNMTWGGLTDPDITHVELYVNGSLAEDIPNNLEFYNLTGLEPATKYNISMRAVDLTGLTGDWCNYTVETFDQFGTNDANETPGGGNSGGDEGNEAPGDGTGSETGSENESGNTIDSSTNGGSDGVIDGGGGGSGGSFSGGNFIMPFTLEPDFYSLFTKTAYSGKVVLIQTSQEIQDRTGVFEVGAVFNKNIFFRLALSSTTLTQTLNSDLAAYLSEISPTDFISDDFVILSTFETIFTDSAGFKELEPSGFVGIKIKKAEFEKTGTDISNLIVLKYKNGVWSTPSFTLVEEDTQYYYLNVEVNSFSVFVVALGGDLTYSTQIPGTYYISTPTVSDDSVNSLDKSADDSKTNEANLNSKKVNFAVNWQPTRTKSIIVFFIVLTSIALIVYVFRRSKRSD